jgi:3'-phosphoadenosine 5'-phosphosulfate sulfotransferase (PAPS reductase)/FAD synthetase
LKMKKYLSFGAGVNSTALLLLLTDQGEDFETIFVNHGGDYPETYEYVTYLREHGFEITEIKPPAYCGCTTIEQYIRKYKFLPGVFSRWCTEHFKVIPFQKYIETPAVVFLGYSYDEKQRAERRTKKHKEENDITYEYSLIDLKISRDSCISVIREHNLKIPPRSTCYFCPFQSKQQIRELFLFHRDLYERVVELEALCSKGGKFTLKINKTIPVIAMENTPPLQKWLK